MLRRWIEFAASRLANAALDRDLIHVDVEMTELHVFDGEHWSTVCSPTHVAAPGPSSDETALSAVDLLPTHAFN